MRSRCTATSPARPIVSFQRRRVGALPSRALASALAASLVFIGPAAGSGAPSTINFNLVLTPADFQSGCSGGDWIDQASCEGLASEPIDGQAFLWVVVSSSNGFLSFPESINAVQFGIEYDADVSAWYSCTGGLQIPGAGWPASGTGIALAWDQCPELLEGETVRVGYFLLGDGDSGTFSITPDPRDGQLLITDCEHRASYACPGNAATADLSVGTVPECAQHDLVVLPPADLAATQEGCGAALTWSHDGENVSTFEVHRDGELVATLNADARAYVDEAVPQGVGPVSYVVSALAACGGEASSDPAQVSLETTPAPADCSATDEICGRVEISWTDTSSDETAFHIERDGMIIGITAANVTAFTDSIYGTVSGNAYSVRAVGPCGPSASSNTDTGAVLAPPPPASALIAEVLTCGALSLSWVDEAENDTETQVVRDGAPIATLPPDATAYEDTGATAGVVHEYVIRSVNTCSSTDSDPAFGAVHAVPPSAPADLAATDGDCNVVTVTWQETSGTEESIELYRDGGLIQTIDAGIEHYADTDAAPDVPHAYTAVALNVCGAGESSIADTGFLVEEAAPIPAVTLVAPESDEGCAESPVTFTWRAEPGAVLYDFEVLGGCPVPALNAEYVTDTTLTVPLPPSLQRYWRVRGLNVCDEWGEWSECRPVRVEPTLEFDYFFATLSYGGMYQFFWSPVPGAERFELYLSPSDDYEDCYVEGPGVQVFSVTGTDTTLQRSDVGAVELTWVRAFGCGALGPPSECTSPGLEIPVVLEYFRAQARGPAVTTEWATRSEQGIAAFHLDRAIGDGPSRRLTETPIPAGSGTYAYEDADIRLGATYTYTLIEIDDRGRETPLASTEVVASGGTRRLALGARPNPFNPRVTLTVEIPHAGRLHLDVLDAAGRRVITLADDAVSPGVTRYVWDGRDHADRRVAPGVYFATAALSGARDVRRLVLLP